METPKETPSPAPIRDVLAMLATLAISESPSQWCLVSLGEAPSGIEIRATVVEAEGTSYLIPLEAAHDLGINPYFTGSWLTLEVNSALDSVGLTAAVSTVLANAGIPCNVFAGYHHDHLLVPSAQAKQAIAILTALRT